MSERVEILMPNGKWEERTSENIKKHELAYPMRCPECDKRGNLCHAPMGPVQRTKPYPHIIFKQKNGERVHLLGCDADRRRDKRITTHPDKRAAGRTPADLWDAMKKRKKDPGKGPGKKGGTGGKTSHTGTGIGGAEPDDRPVERVAGLPKTPDALLETLLDLNLDSVFAGKKVEDLLIDHRTVDRFRKEGIPEGAFALVLAKRLAMVNRTFTADEDEFVLADCKYNASKEAKPYGCMQFRLRLHGTARKEMFDYLKIKDDNTYIVIFSRWSKDPDNQNTYYALDADEDHIACTRLPDEKK